MNKNSLPNEYDFVAKMKTLSSADEYVIVG